MTGTQTAYRAYRWLVWLIILAVAIQFFLAGTGLSIFGGESIEPHEGLGNLIVLLGLILLVLAFVAKQPPEIKGMSGVFFVLVILQVVWAEIEDPAILRALHVFDAFLIVGLLTNLATRVGFPLQASSDDAG